MRRLLILPLLLAAAFAPPASADDVPCHGVHSGNTVIGICAGVICNDLCGPRVVVHGQCSGAPANLAALCALYDNVRIG